MTDLSKCENAHTGATTIITPKCWDNLAIYTVIINYGWADDERDIFELCGSCSDTIIKDARKHGYEATRKLHTAEDHFVEA